MLALALWLIAVTASEATAQSAYVAFACGIVVWGWQLLGFLHRLCHRAEQERLRAGLERACRASFRRSRTSVYHELAAILGAVALVALTYGQPNRIALWTYIILWLMHSSAKLNLFLGVPNLGAEMLPGHLAFLTSFMARRPMNALFPVSVTAGTAGSALLFLSACRSGASAIRHRGIRDARFADGAGGGRALVLVVPIDGNALWRAFRRSRADGPAATANRVERDARGAHEVEEASARSRPRRRLPGVPAAVCDARTSSGCSSRSRRDISAPSIACMASCRPRPSGFVSN